MARTRRFGLKAMVKSLRNFCRLYNTFTPVLLRTFGSTHPILVAAAAVMAACEVFIQAVADETELGT